MDFIENNPLVFSDSSKNDLILFFRSEDEKLRLVYEENNEDFDYIFKGEAGDFFLIFSTKQNTYVNERELKVSLRNDPVTKFFYGLSLEAVPEPENWLYFLKKYFIKQYNKGDTTETNRQAERLLDFLCIQYRMIVNNIHKIETTEIQSNVFTSGVAISELLRSTNNNVEVFDRHLPAFFKTYVKVENNKIDGSNEHEQTFQFFPILNCSVYSSEALKGGFQNGMLNSMVNLVSKNEKVNFFILLEDTKYNKQNLHAIWIKTIIKSFFLLEGLFLPGQNENIVNEKSEFDFKLKSALYNDIVEKEYASILAYIIKSTRKYIIL